LQAAPEYAHAEAGMIAWEPFSGAGAARTMCSKRGNSRSGCRTTSDSFHIPTRPSMAFHGNLQVAIREAKTLIEAGSHIAFFAPTTGESSAGRRVYRILGFPYQIDLAGDRAPEYLRERAQSRQRSGVR
jgi:phosphoribulokinase